MSFADATATATEIMQALPPPVAVFALSLFTGFVPIVSLEASLLALAIALPGPQALPLAAAAAFGQVLANGLLYGSGLKLSRTSTNTRMEALLVRLERSTTGARLLLLTSAVLGIPPFFLVSVAAGALRIPFLLFLSLGFTGQVLRFAAILVLPSLFAWGRAL